MTSKAQRLRAIADKVAADIARLEKEICDRRANMARAKERVLAVKPKGSFHSVPSWFAAWSRHAPPLARAVGQLERAKRRLPGARDRAVEAKIHEAGKVRVKAANAAMIARIDARQAAPSITERWNKERREEEKRARKLKNKLAKRLGGEPEMPEWMRRPRRLPDPILQPDLTPDPETEAPRPGLLPGDYAVLPVTRVMRLVDRPRLPEVWTAAYVGVRMIEAHKILSRMPASIWPKGFGAAWPLYKVEASEELLTATEVTRQRIRFAPSSEAVARMNEAIGWPMQFLAHRSGAAADVNWWAQDAAWEQMEFDSRSAPWTLLQVIADGLNAAHEVVR